MLPRTYDPSTNYKRKAVWKVCIKSKNNLQVDENYKIVTVKDICQQLCKSFVQVPMRKVYGFILTDLNLGCLDVAYVLRGSLLVCAVRVE